MGARYKETREEARNEVFSGAREQLDWMMWELFESEALFGKDSDELEAWVREEGRELLRRLLQGHYNLRAPAVPVEAVECADEVERTYTRDAEDNGRALATFLGVVTLMRVAFCTRDEPNLYPLEADLNVSPRKVSRHLQKHVCEWTCDIAFHKVGSKLEEYTGVTTNNRELQEVVVEVAQDFDSFYEARKAPSAEADKALILTADGKGVVMHKGSLRPETRKRAEAAPPRKKGQPVGPGEKKERKRMATVCAIYDHTCHERCVDDIVCEERIKSPPDSCENKRVWADLRRTQRESLRELVEEAKRRDPRQERDWVTLIDGQPTLLSQLQDIAEDAEVHLHFIIDIIHVIERLWGAANALYGSGSDKASTWVEKQLRRLLEGRAKTVIHSARVSAGKLDIPKSRKQTVLESCNYLQARLPYLRYHIALAKGWPISTGVVEGTCRHLINDRLDITGARWHLDSAEAVLRIRALIASRDWEEYWAWHKSMAYHRDHALKFRDAQPPKPVYPTLRNHLELVP